MSKSEPPLPLTPAVFHILLALVGKERHGYDIMEQVSELLPVSLDGDLSDRRQ